MSVFGPAYSHDAPAAPPGFPPLFVCYSCERESRLITTRLQIQIMLFDGAVFAVLVYMTVTLFLFANKRMLRSPIFWGSVGALVIDTVAISTSLLEYIPGYTRNYFSGTYINLICARWCFVSFTPWACSLVLLAKLYAFYPATIRERKQTILLRVLVALKARVLLDICSIGFLCGGYKVRGRVYVIEPLAFHFASVMLNLVDSLIVSTVLLRTSWRFYKTARLRMSLNSRRIRLIFESIGMTFIGAIPPQIAYAIGLVLYAAKPHAFSKAVQSWIAIWYFTSFGLFGVLSTVYSSIASVPGVASGSTHAQRPRVPDPDKSPPHSDPSTVVGHEQQQQGAGAVASPASHPPPVVQKERTDTFLSIFFVQAQPSLPESTITSSPSSSGGRRPSRRREAYASGAQDQAFELGNRRNS